MMLDFCLVKVPKGENKLEDSGELAVFDEDLKDFLSIFILEISTDHESSSFLADGVFAVDSKSMTDYDHELVDYHLGYVDLVWIRIGTVVHFEKYYNKCFIILEINRGIFK